jgi:AraC-like DNA-binding protein
MRVADWLEVEDVEGELSLYRVRTVGLLRKYLRMSAEAGRLPSLIGREFFRATVSSYQTQSFEDVIIFLIDMELMLDALDEEARTLIARVIFQEYSHDDVADMLGIRRPTFQRRFADAIDRLSRLMLDRGLIDALPTPKHSQSVERRPKEKVADIVAQQAIPGAIACKSASDENLVKSEKGAKSA